MRSSGATAHQRKSAAGRDVYKTPPAALVFLVAIGPLFGANPLRPAPTCRWKPWLPPVVNLPAQENETPAARLEGGIQEAPRVSYSSVVFAPINSKSSSCRAK